jgi:hypothetical protein
MRKLNIIVILFYSLKLLCQHDIYAPREDLLKTYGIKEYTKTSHFKGKRINNNNDFPHKYYLNKNGKVIFEEYKQSKNCDGRVEYKFNDAEVLISKAYYLNNSNNHERMYTYIYSDSMKLKEEWVFDSLDNVEWYVFYNENEKPVECHHSKNQIRYYYYEKGSLECEVFNDENDISEHIYFYENDLLKQLKIYKGFQPERIIYYDYDENKNIISEHVRYINGELYFSKLYEYDHEQRLTKLRRVFYGPDKHENDGLNNVDYDESLEAAIMEENFKYNKVGLLKELKWTTNNKNVKFVTVFEYK